MSPPSPDTIFRLAVQEFRNSWNTAVLSILGLQKAKYLVKPWRLYL